MSKLPPFDAGFGVYVHWPFCASKCPYCDFNSHVRRQGIDEARYLAAFRRELVTWAAMTPGRTVSSIFFGGGTPSLMKPETVGGILDAIAANWAVDAKVEVTLEANPPQRFSQRRTTRKNQPWPAPSRWLWRNGGQYGRPVKSGTWRFFSDISGHRRLG